ncbi:EAL domain-containing protein [Alkalihalobacterium chitinilyticum]|uniref:EAL domain-containing protein n=1 Tax=Alkalihalobacterium chitinilyticum TaxID=2980103 RepID=A0ABT5VAN1_9BACI|nr:EAL domain-containing protein [Alkalihalobacterium chitinilyticum]MDE5412526.1 EAL domain-containing protein [Alkalihalobacterium chitinilyticum]
MTVCSSCSSFPDLSEQGALLIYCKIEADFLDLENRIKQKYKVESDKQVLKIRYDSFTMLEQIVNDIDLLLQGNSTGMFGSWIDEQLEKQPVLFPTMTPFDQLHERIRHRDYVTVINQRKFTHHIQPIIQVNDGKVFGYEFLLRPTDNHFPFFPGELFAFSQRAGLQSLLDSQARIGSIEVSAKLLQEGQKRFINFLPSSIYDPNHCLKSTFKVVEQFNVNPSDLVFEVVETEKIKDIDHLKKIFSTYKQHGVHVALDDIGTGYSTIEVLKELNPNFAKIDRHLVDHCDMDKEKQQKLKAIQEVANANGIILLAEGIERKEELTYCKEIGVDLAQGYLIARPSAHPISNTLLTNS